MASARVRFEDPEPRRSSSSDGGGGGGAAAAARINQVAPATAAASSDRKPPPESLAGRLSKLIFFVHLAAAAILITYLSLRGFLSRTPTFRPLHYHVPLLASSSVSAASSLPFLLLTLRRPSLALRCSLWISPILTLLSGFLLLAAGDGISLAFAAPALSLSLIQSLYACWIIPRLHHAALVLSSSSFPAASPLSSISIRVSAAVISALACTGFYTLGFGGIAANAPTLSPLYISLLLLSLSWTMHVIRSIVHVAVSRVAHSRLAGGDELGVPEAFRAAATGNLGAVCVGSAVAPAVSAVRGAARAMGMVAGDSDEFLFSCTSCSAGVADRLVVRANRWGWVRVGVYGMGFGRASRDTWEMFERGGMGRLIDKDVTGSFCFLAGVAGGGVAALTGGSWALAVDKSHVPEVTVYAFLFGYFINRIAMAWPQACVSAYHVAYAEDPQNPHLGSAIPDRIRELQLSPD